MNPPERAPGSLAELPPRRLGSVPVAPIGLGCMNLSHVYHPLPSRAEAERLLLGARDLGITHFDTAALYGFGANERLIGEVLATRRDQVVLASKCGMVGVDGVRVIDGRPEALRATCEQALTNLRTDVIDLYYLHRLDPAVPVEESVGALAGLVAEGKIRAIGLSEISATTLRRAHATHPIAAVQNEYSLWSRNPELGVLAVCRELGITLVAFSPLARGFLTDLPPHLEELPAADLRHAMPRFQGEAYAANLTLRDGIAALARQAGCTTAQLALAWLLAQGEDIVPIPGTRSLGHLTEDVGAAYLTIPEEILTAAGDLLNHRTVHGRRYGPAAAADVDTEAFPDAG